MSDELPPDPDAVKRMAHYDALPPELRRLSRQLPIAMAIKSPEEGQKLIEALRAGFELTFSQPGCRFTLMMNRVRIERI